MWRTGGRALSQIVGRLVASSASTRPPNHGHYLNRVFAPTVAAAAASSSSLRFNAGRHLHGTAWTECGVPANSEDLRDSVPFRKQKDWRAAEAKLVEKICGIVKRGEWGVDTVNELAKLKIRLRSKLLNKVLRELDDPDVANSFFQWAGKQGRFKHSLQTYHAIIEIMGAAQKFDAQNQLLQDMQRQGLQANTSTFNILLLGFSRSNSPDKVLATFSQMQQFGVTPNAFTFKVTIRSLVWNARPLEGLSVYAQMTEFGYVPDNFTYNGLIEGLCQAGHVDEAFVIFQDMQDRGFSPDSIAHAALIKGLDVKGRVQEALRMFQEMTGKNLRSVVETRNGVMGVFSKRHKGDGLSSNVA